MKSSLVERLDIYVGAATLAAHASFLDPGFRIRDVEFFIELFLNWGEDIDTTSTQLQTTQVTRYLAQLVGAGFARRTHQKRAPAYSLSRLGLLELLTRITNNRLHLSAAQALFRICFLKSYKPRLAGLIEHGGSQFPPALQMELSALLDVEGILNHEIKRFERALTRLDRRIDDGLRTSALTTNRLAAGVPFRDVVKEVESRYPYELNSMKPLSELISTIAPDQRCWELQKGNLLRVSTMWEPQRAIVRETLKQLKKIREDS